MKSLLQYTYPIGKEDLDYLEKLTVGVVGSRMLAEIMWRVGVGCVKYIGDFISTSDVFTDVSLSLDEIGNYDVIHSKDRTLVISYILEELEKDKLMKMLRGCDVIISHRYATLCAKVAERFGVPFMPPAVTSILPDEMDKYIEAIKILERWKFNPITYSLLCSAQALEFINLCTSGNTVLAPDAYFPINREPYFKKIDLSDLNFE